MREYAEMTALDVWYSHLDLNLLAEKAADKVRQKTLVKNHPESLAKQHVRETNFPKSPPCTMAARASSTIRL